MGSLRCAAVLCAALASSRALAETDIKAADELFAKGLALRESNLEQSCSYFKQSLDLNPQAIGTLMNVALCDEKLGKIASALERFSEARDRAKEGNLPEYAAEATAHIDVLKVDVPKVTLAFLGERPQGTRVLLGDRVIPAEEYEGGKQVNVDPGELVIVVSAPGRLAYETKLLINKREEKAIQVPELKKGITVKSSRRTIGIITTATGGAALGTGIVLGLVARSIWNTNHDKCMIVEGDDICNPEEQSQTERARTIGNVGTVVGVIGFAATGVGIYLWLTAPKDSAPGERRVTILPDVTPEGAGLTAIGRF